MVDSKESKQISHHALHEYRGSAQPLKDYPEWEEIYQAMPVEEMPWFCHGLDHDLAEELKRRHLTKGTFLDIGTGPGTQAIELTKRGFTVTATDISETAISQARLRAPQINFMLDDIVNSRISEHFNYIFDRGCFHALSPDDRHAYVCNVYRVLAPNGMLFLKTFGFRKHKIVPGPYRFKPNELRSIFEKKFEIELIAETEFCGIFTPSPKALFLVMRKK